MNRDGSSRSSRRANSTELLKITKQSFGEGDICEGVLGTGDGDIEEVVFLGDLPGGSGCGVGHEGVASEEIDVGPFESFGFVDGAEGERWWDGGVIIGEEGGDLGGEMGEGSGDGDECVDAIDAVGELREFVGWEFGLGREVGVEEGREVGKM